MFVNRKTEIERLKLALSSKKSQLIVIYGRRRCGKSALLRKIMDDSFVYYSADMSETPLQIKALSERMEKVVPGFAGPVYGSWDVLLRSFNNALKKRVTLCIDEFPYLVKNSPELPSVLQNLVDERDHGNFNIILCGSSQAMMRGMVLDSHAPLYGRTNEILRVDPMQVGNLKEFLGVNAVDAVTEYSIWGGVPRYWEIRKESKSIEEALLRHVVNPHGLLADEPERLFADELRTSIQAYTLLALIAAGCHRLTEMASRVGKPATHLSGILSFLTGLKYIRRELPWGESVRSTKKTLYKIDDPFLRFWFTFIVPEKSRIEAGLTGQVMKRINRELQGYVSAEWENLCRRAVPFLGLPGEFEPGARWWGRAIDGTITEVDVVACSSDGKSLLIGECKWSDEQDAQKTAEELQAKIKALPFVSHHEVIPALFLKKKPKNNPKGFLIFTPGDVVGVMV